MSQETCAFLKNVLMKGNVLVIKVTHIYKHSLLTSLYNSLCDTLQVTCFALAISAQGSPVRASMSVPQVDSAWASTARPSLHPEKRGKRGEEAKGKYSHLSPSPNLRERYVTPLLKCTWDGVFTQI